jgi:hypothetical protein
MKKTLFLYMTFLYAVFPAFSQAKDVFEVFINEAGSAKSIIITGYSGDDAELIIPAEIDGLPVTAIGRRAFFGNTAIKAVLLPEGMEIIGESAFENCTELASINFPESLKLVERRAFWRCLPLIMASYIEIKNQWGKEVIGIGP